MYIWIFSLIMSMNALDSAPCNSKINTYAQYTCPQRSNLYYPYLGELRAEAAVERQRTLVLVHALQRGDDAFLRRHLIEICARGLLPLLRLHDHLRSDVREQQQRRHGAGERPEHESL